MGPIYKNKAKCLHCGDILISVKDFEECSCGRLRMGGGSMMIYRTGIEGKDYKELTEYNQEFFQKENPNSHVPNDLPK